MKRKRTLRDRGICVIIPTYNNAGTIGDVVSRALMQCDDVIVVCDGCTDGTLDILGSLPQKPRIVEIPVNSGKGAALKAGFVFARNAGFSYAITLDGDGQHFPEDIPVLLQANLDHPGALVVGARRNLKDMQRSGGSRFANSFSNFWFAVQTWRRLEDTQTGYRLYPLKKLGGMKFLTSRYEAELALLVFASWRGVRLVSVPVEVSYPSAEDRVSHFRPVKDFVRISVLNVALCILALVYGLPRTALRFLMTVLRTVYSLFFFSIGTMFLLTPAIFLYTAIGKMTERKKENLHRIICGVARFTLFRHGIPGCRYSQKNDGGEDFSRPAVIICNHQSHLDLLPMLAFTPKLVVLTNDWVWNSPFYSYIIHKAEFLPVSMGMDSAMPQLRDLVRRGYSIAIYPESTRSLDGSVNRFHQGAFYLADALGLDIVPAVLYGTGKALPKHGRYLRKWPVHMEIDPRITPDRQAEMGKDFRQRASSARKYYIGRLDDISNRIEQDV